MKINNSVYKLYPATGAGLTFEVKEDNGGGKQYRDIFGWVSTPHGYVRAVSMYFQGKYSRSTLYMLKQGCEHSRTFDKAFTQRGLVTKAKQFANDLFGELVLVPKLPTHKMIVAAAGENYCEEDQTLITREWKAMLNVAQQHTAGGK